MLFWRVREECGDVGIFRIADRDICLASPLSAGATGRIFAGPGGYLGRYPVPTTELLESRDHDRHPPFTPGEVARLVDR